MQYSAPIIVKQADQDVLICWTGDSVSGLLPSTGKNLWRIEFPPNKMPIGISSPVLNVDRLFLTSFYDGSMMLRLKQNKADAEVLWRRVGESERNTDALHSIISTPLFIGDYIYGDDKIQESDRFLHLHAERIMIPLDAQGKNLVITAPLPAHMK